MARVCITVAHKSDGTLTPLYTGFDVGEAIKALDQASAAGGAAKAEVYYGGTPYRTRRFISGREKDEIFDEANRMKRIHAIRQLDNAQLKELAKKHDLTFDDKMLNRLPDRNKLIVAIYDAEMEADEIAPSDPTLSEDSDHLAKAQARGKELEALDDKDLLSAAAKAGVDVGETKAPLKGDVRDDLVLKVMEKEFPEPKGELQEARNAGSKSAQPGALPQTQMKGLGSAK